MLGQATAGGEGQAAEIKGAVLGAMGNRAVRHRRPSQVTRAFLPPGGWQAAAWLRRGSLRVRVRRRCAPCRIEQPAEGAGHRYAQ